MRRKRRVFSSEFKLKVILASLKERESLAQLSKKFDLHQNQISKWKNDFLENAKSNLVASNLQQDNNKEKEIEKLYSKIGMLLVEMQSVTSCKVSVKQGSTVLKSAFLVAPSYKLFSSVLFFLFLSINISCIVFLFY